MVTFKPILNNSMNAEISSIADKHALLHKVDQALDEVRPHLAVDGGNLEVVEITDDLVLRIKWLGNCENCSMSVFTLRAGIEHTIKKHVPEITKVEAVNN